jgi:hypothetical protein
MMSGLNLLFETSIDYERTHQIALFTLLQKSDLSKHLLDIDRKINKINWEPNRQLFDLGIETDLYKYLIEIKMWASLYKSQFEKQREALNKEGSYGVYLFLGTTWFEYDSECFKRDFGYKCVRIGYVELIKGLNDVLISHGNPTEIYELALAYRNAIRNQFERILNAYTGPVKDRVFYYSLYYKMKELLKDIPCSIYGANNPGGQVSILNNNHWHEVGIEGINVQLFYELVNGELCFKIRPDTDDYVMKDHIRNVVRPALQKAAGSDLILIKTGRTGEYMTIFKIKHDFTNLNLFNESIKIYKFAYRILLDTIGFLKE